MRIVPGVVVDEDGPVGHGRDLVAVVPPGHDLCVLGRVLAQPVVRLEQSDTRNTPAQEHRTLATSGIVHVFLLTHYQWELSLAESAKRGESNPCFTSLKSSKIIREPSRWFAANTMDGEE